MMPKFGERFNREDSLVDWPYEDMMFRWDYNRRGMFRKFYGETKEDKRPDDCDLFDQACVWGDEITRDRYEKGAKKL